MNRILRISPVIALLTISVGCTICDRRPLCGGPPPAPKPVFVAPPPPAPVPVVYGAPPVQPAGGFPVLAPQPTAPPPGDPISHAQAAANPERGAAAAGAVDLEVAGAGAMAAGRWAAAHRGEAEP